MSVLHDHLRRWGYDALQVGILVFLVFWMVAHA
jgi:hypothetical protein